MKIFSKWFVSKREADELKREIEALEGYKRIHQSSWDELVFKFRQSERERDSFEKMLEEEVSGREHEIEATAEFYIQREIRLRDKIVRMRQQVAELKKGDASD